MFIFGVKWKKMFLGERVMKKTLYAYKIELQPVSEKKALTLESFEEDFISVISELCENEQNIRKHDFIRDKKILYLDLYEYNNDVSVVNLKFISAKYDARRRVIDTETLDEKGILKGVGDGDEEKNHVCFRFFKDNTAVCLSETNYYGVGFSKIIYYLQKKIKEYHKNKKDGCYYNLIYKNIVSEDFLKSLAKIKKIRAVTLTVDQEEVKVSDFKALSGRNDISPNVDILLKPAATGLGIRKDTVEEFFKIYNRDDRNVKRVTVDGEGISNENISFDTEQMKTKIIVDVDVTGDTSEVKTRSIFDELFIEILRL